MEFDHEALKFIPHERVVLFAILPYAQFDPYQVFIAPLQQLSKAFLSLASHIEATASEGDDAVMFGNPALTLVGDAEYY